MAYENEADFPANVKTELARLRQASNDVDKAITDFKTKIPDNDFINFDIRNAKIVDEKTGQVINPGDVKKAMSDTSTLSTTDKVKNFVTSYKWWLIGGVVVIVIGVGLFIYFRKRR